MSTDRFASRRRAYIIGFIFIAMLSVLLIRLYELQFVQYEDFRSQAEKNSIRELARDPLRGLIFDRDSNIIVDNNPSYTLTITPFEFSWETLPLLQSMFNVDTVLVRHRVLRTGVHSFEPVKIMRNLSFEQLALLEEYRNQLPGVSYLVESRRIYNMKAHLSHLLGYTKEISPKLLDRLGSYYRPGDIVGFNGAEAWYEDVLRGRKGYGYHTVNAYGKVVESFDHGQSDIRALEGTDLMITIDMDLQAYGERLMRGKRGAIVALDPTNGEILAFISSPDYNLSDFSGRITVEDWHRLRDDQDFPLYNRCSMAAYPPGSTFKMMLAIAALQEGIITPETKIQCNGSYLLAGQEFGCHGAHGNINVVSAIEHSCNVFFYKLVFKLGFDNWKRYGEMFHFGKLTGIDISNENPGILPTEEYYNKRYGNKWNIGYLVNLGIGQGEVNTTPLQMAAFTATIANKGTFYQPHVVKSIFNRELGYFTDVETDASMLPVDAVVWNTVQLGMHRAVNGRGTGYAARVGGARVAGKTGTAQNPPHPDHAWFVGYAPGNNPRIALSVIVENGGFGGTTAAPIAGAMIRYYLHGPPVYRQDSDSTAEQELPEFVIPQNTQVLTN